MRVAFAARMLRTRPVWMRGLRLYRAIASAGVLEQPRISALMMGVHECAALAAASPAAFSVEGLLPELEPLLTLHPEWFSYCPEPEAQSVESRLVSPYAV